MYWLVGFAVVAIVVVLAVSNYRQQTVNSKPSLDWSRFETAQLDDILDRGTFSYSIGGKQKNVVDLKGDKPTRDVEVTGTITPTDRHEINTILTRRLGRAKQL